MQQQPGTYRRGGRQWPDGADHPPEMGGVGEPTLGDALGAEPGEGAAGDAAGVGGEGVGAGVAGGEGPGENVAGVGAGFEGEGDPGAGQRADQRGGLPGDEQAVGDEAAGAGAEVERPGAGTAGGPGAAEPGGGGGGWVGYEPVIQGVEVLIGAALGQGADTDVGAAAGQREDPAVAGQDPLVEREGDPAWWRRDAGEVAAHRDPAGRPFRYVGVRCWVGEEVGGEPAAVAAGHDDGTGPERDVLRRTRRATGDRALAVPPRADPTDVDAADLGAGPLGGADHCGVEDHPRDDAGVGVGEDGPAQPRSGDEVEVAAVGDEEGAVQSGVGREVLIGDPETAGQGHRPGADQVAAGLVPREPGPVEQQDTLAGPGEADRRGAAGRSRPDDDDIRGLVSHVDVPLGRC